LAFISVALVLAYVQRRTILLTRRAACVGYPRYAWGGRDALQFGPCWQLIMEG